MKTLVMQLIVKLELGGSSLAPVHGTMTEDEYMDT